MASNSENEKSRIKRLSKEFQEMDDGLHDILNDLVNFEKELQDNKKYNNLINETKNIIFNQTLDPYFIELNNICSKNEENNISKEDAEKLNGIKTAGAIKLNELFKKNIGLISEKYFDAVESYYTEKFDQMLTF